MMKDGYTVTLSAAMAALAPPERLTVSQWADRYRILPTKGAAEAGRWRTDRTPYLREIMDALHPDHPARRIVLMKSVQIGATEAGLNWIGFFIAQMKAPMLAVQPSHEMVTRFSKQRLSAMIADTPPLRELVRPARERDSGNTQTLKEYPGGCIILAGANSPASLRSMPARYLFLDEVDAYPGDLEGEGDPVALAEARASTFPNRKIFLCSTPTISSLSRIQREYEASDQRRYYVPCPECGEHQTLVWEQLHWPPGEPAQAAYACPQCGSLIQDWQKTELLRRGQWRAERPGRSIVGFHLNSLYTPPGLGLSWSELAALWETAQGDASAQRTFINLRLGLPTADPDDKLDEGDLQSRAGPFKARSIPAGCLFLSVGIDIQKDRAAVTLVGHGRNGVLFILDWLELRGDPTGPDLWEALDGYLDQPLEYNSITLRISAVAIDAGFLPDHVLAYTRTRKGRTIAVRGSTFRHRPIIAAKPSKVDITAGGRTAKQGAEVWFLGTDTAKEALFAKLAGDRERHPDERLIRFAKDLDASFYAQLCAEMFDPRRRCWVKIRPRNEALDCVLYATAAAMQPRHRVHLWKEAQWQKVETALGINTTPGINSKARTNREEAINREEVINRDPVINREEGINRYQDINTPATRPHRDIAPPPPPAAVINRPRRPQREEWAL